MAIRLEARDRDTQRTACNVTQQALTLRGITRPVEVDFTLTPGAAG